MKDVFIAELVPFLPTLYWVAQYHIGLSINTDLYCSLHLTVII